MTPNGRPNTYGQNERQTSLFNRTFEKEWITKGFNLQAVTFSEELGRYLAKLVTTSQVRNIFGELKRIQSQKDVNGLKESALPAFYLLRAKMAYAVGRQKSESREIQSAYVTLKKIFDEAHSCVNVKDFNTFNNFVIFFESIIAYHKAYGGK